MFLIEDEQFEYAVGGAVFKYERLTHDHLAKLRYLNTVRGVSNEDLYETWCIAVGLRGWEGLQGKDGPIPWPLELPLTALTTAEEAQMLQLILVTSSMTEQARARLNGAFWVVKRLPLDVARELATRVQEHEPESLKKRQSEISKDGSSSSIPSADMNLPVSIVDETNGDESLVTAGD